MAASRWKRFPFFDRHTLTIPSEVLEDVLPVDGSRTSRGGGRSGASNNTLSVESEAVSISVSTAALPLTTKREEVVEGEEPDALQAMWSSLTACASPLPETTAADEIPVVSSATSSGPSQKNSSLATDGLVLVFVTSRDTELVHCFDVTVRCNPPEEKELEDLDGWRGYFAPFGLKQEENEPDQRIFGIASCRNQAGAVHLACISNDGLVVWEDPHLYLSCRRPLTIPKTPDDAVIFKLQYAWSEGNCRVVDIVPGFVAVGTDVGTVFCFVYANGGIRPYLRIPAQAEGMEVVSVKLALGEERVSLFVAYRLAADSSVASAAGVCCYEMPRNANATLSAPSARHDLDGRFVGSPSLVDAAETPSGMQVTVARPDGLYSYSKTERTGVAPIDGTKLAICLVPPPSTIDGTREVTEQMASGYALVASTDSKSGRDAVDIYDATNKLVAFHLLLSPGHRAVRAVGVTTSSSRSRSSAIILTSGGSLVTLTEKLTEEKVSLLVQKNLYSAAIVVAYADPSYESSRVTDLYRDYADHLYRKGDFSGSIDQYCHTIGSLESSHVIFRFLDAPKIPLLVRYLEKLRTRDLATQVHNELLRTCYLKLNDTEAADAIAASFSSSVNKASMSSILSNLSHNPKDALATICSLDAHQAAEVLVIHGASLVRALPRETAGVVIALCVGTYSPKSLADATLIDSSALRRMVEHGTDDRPKMHEPYPFHLFAPAFIENPKMLRLILAHCNRNKCYITPSLRRTHLELTLSEWNQAKRVGDAETERVRHKEAIAALTDSHCREIGDYDALVIVQLAGFSEGELLLFERLQMTPMLLERYAKDGSEKARRQMLALSQSDPEVLADVLGHFVDLASERLNEPGILRKDDDSEDEETEEILDDIREALAHAKRQAVLPPVRVARILAGEGSGQFSAQEGNHRHSNRKTVPLSVALDYVGTILEESRKEISRLRSEVDEYNQLCNSMESEIESLLRASQSLPVVVDKSNQPNPRMNIDELYSKIRAEDSNPTGPISEEPREAFWRDMNQSEDTFDTIARFFAKGVIP